MPYDDTSYYADLNGDVDTEGRAEPSARQSDACKDNGSNHVDHQYRELLIDILSDGHESGDRTGTGTIKSFGHQMRFDLQEGFPLLTSKATWFDGIKRELLWFLRGRTNVYHLMKQGVGIWTGDAYRAYRSSVENPHGREKFEELMLVGPPKRNRFAREWGDLGDVYGKRWRAAEGFDQVENLIDQLQENPDSRRLRVSAWKPSAHMEGAPDELDAVLPPCHVSFQCFTRELSLEERASLFDGAVAFGTPEALVPLLDAAGVPRRALSLKWNQRAADTFLGLPFNIASYALLTHMLAKQAGMMPEELIFQGGDCHLYRSHLDQAKELLSRTPKAALPALSLPEEVPDDPAGYDATQIEVEGYDPHPPIKAPLET